MFLINRRAYLNKVKRAKVDLLECVFKCPTWIFMRATLRFKALVFPYFK